jgi:hypothetical protein
MSQWCMCEAYQEALLQSNPLEVFEVMQLCGGHVERRQLHIKLKHKCDRALRGKCG